MCLLRHMSCVSMCCVLQRHEDSNVPQCNAFEFPVSTAVSARKVMLCHEMGLAVLLSDVR